MARNTAHNTPSSETIDKERRCLEMRRARMTFDAIAIALGYSHRSTARKAYERALARTLQPAATLARQEELDGLDRIYFEAYSIATDAPRAADPARQLAAYPGQLPLVRLRAIETCVRISKRRSALLGLDAPIRVDHRVTDSLMAEIEGLVDELSGNDPQEVAAP